MQASIVASVVARIYNEGLRSGVPETLLVRALGRHPSSLSEEKRVSIERVYDCFAACLRATRDPAFPLRAASAIELEDYAVLGFALLTSQNADQAFERLARFGHLITDSGAWQLRRDARRGIAHLDWIRAGRRGLGQRAANECAVAEVVVGLRRTIAADWAPATVRFRHPAPPAPEAHQQFFAAPIEWHSSVDGLDLPLDALAVQSHRYDAGMSRFFGGALERRGDADRPSCSRVRELLRQELPSGAPSLVAIARRLAVSERTLRRQLAGEGTTWRSLVADERRSAALELLRDGRSITDIAFLIGFADTSAFSRAFRRWYGVSAREARRGYGPLSDGSEGS